MFFYKKIKSKRNMRKNCIFFVSIYLSIILSISVYFTTYNVSQIIFLSGGTTIYKRILLSVISFSLQAFIALTLLAHAKDIVFSILITYFIGGFLLSDRFLNNTFSNSEKVASIVLIIVNSLSFLYTSIRYKLTVFGVFKDEDVDSVINKMIARKQSSIS